MTYDFNITFDDNLLTGNRTIDAQHKELIDRIRNFVVACQNGDSKVKAIKMLDYLDEYTDFHFKEEEALQEKAGIGLHLYWPCSFRLLTVHAALHARLCSAGSPRRDR